MTVDTTWLDDQIDEQLMRLGEHRERRAGLESIGHAPRQMERAVIRLPVLAAAAATLVLMGSGFYLALRAGSEGRVVDAVGRTDVAIESDPDVDPDSAGGSARNGMFTGPSGSYPGPVERDDSPDAGSTRGQLVGDNATGTVAPSTTAEPGEVEETSGGQSPPATLPTPTTGSEATIGGDHAGEPALQDVTSAGAALSETSTAMVELTAGLASSGAASAGGKPRLAGDRRGREQLASAVAAGAADQQPNCASTELNADLSISINFANCPADDGRPVTGTLVASVKRWIPFELAVVVDEMTIGDDRLWLNATITFSPAAGDGALEPVLNGEILTESAGVVTHVEGSARFLDGRTVLNGKLGYVTRTEVTAADTVIYRPGQTVVASTFVDVSVAEGSCAPSSGTADYQAFTVAGVSGGGRQTDNVELVDFNEEIVANVTYRASTPVDGKVDLRVGGERTDHRLLVPCS